MKEWQVQCWLQLIIGYQILVDGFISTVTAKVAKHISENVNDYMIIGHRSTEPGHSFTLQVLEKEPLINLQTRLGEGSGAAVVFLFCVSTTLIAKRNGNFSIIRY